MQNEASNAPREGRIRKRDGIDTSDGSHKLCAAHCLLGGQKSLRFHVWKGRRRLGIVLKEKSAFA